MCVCGWVSACVREWLSRCASVCVRMRRDTRRLGECAWVQLTTTTCPKPPGNNPPPPPPAPNTHTHTPTPTHRLTHTHYVPHGRTCLSGRSRAQHPARSSATAPCAAAREGAARGAAEAEMSPHHHDPHPRPQDDACAFSRDNWVGVLSGEERGRRALCLRYCGDFGDYSPPLCRHPPPPPPPPLRLRVACAMIAWGQSPT